METQVQILTQLRDFGLTPDLPHRVVMKIKREWEAAPGRKGGIEMKTHKAAAFSISHTHNLHLVRYCQQTNPNSEHLVGNCENRILGWPGLEASPYVLIGAETSSDYFDG